MNRYIKDIEFEDGVAVVSITGDATFDTMADIQAEFKEKTRGLKIKNILFNLKGIHEVDSSSIAVLVGILKYMKIHQTGDKIGIINYPPDIVTLQQIHKVDPLIIEFQSKEEAIASLR